MVPFVGKNLASLSLRMGRFSHIYASFHLDTSSQGFTKVFHWTDRWTMFYLFCQLFDVRYKNYSEHKPTQFPFSLPLGVFWGFLPFFLNLFGWFGWILLGFFNWYLLGFLLFIVLLFEIQESFLHKSTRACYTKLVMKFKFHRIFFFIGRCWSALPLEHGYTFSQYVLKQSLWHIL